MKLFKGKKKKGFTLVELMVVVGIIALLLLLVVPRLAGNTEKAKTRTFESNYRTLASDITVALVADDSSTELKSVLKKAGDLADKPKGATYTVVLGGPDNAKTFTSFQATMGTYTLTFDATNGTTKVSGTAKPVGATF